MDANIFTNTTKQICYCSFASIFLIILFIISPLNRFVVGSTFMKFVILILLGYTLYLNTGQINMMKFSVEAQNSENIKSQLNINIMCSYMFGFFVGLLILFIMKSFF
jgi:hypothetical protein